MKHRLKQLISSACALILVGNIQIASADLVTDTETLLNWAENTYPQFFPSRRATRGTIRPRGPRLRGARDSRLRLA